MVVRASLGTSLINVLIIHIMPKNVTLKAPKADNRMAVIFQYSTVTENGLKDSRQSGYQHSVMLCDRNFFATLLPHALVGILLKIINDDFFNVYLIEFKIQLREAS